MNIKQLVPLLCFFIGFLMALICALIFFLGLKPIIRNLLAKVSVGCAFCIEFTPEFNFSKSFLGIGNSRKFQCNGKFPCYTDSDEVQCYLL